MYQQVYFEDIVILIAKKCLASREVATRYYCKSLQKTLYVLMAVLTQPTWLQAVGLTTFSENGRFGNMRIITSISIVSLLSMSSSSSSFTYKAVEVIFGNMYFYFDLQTVPNITYSENLTTIPEISLRTKRRYILSTLLVLYSPTWRTSVDSWQKTPCLARRFILQ